MKYQVYYNMMGVLPVYNYFGSKEEAEAFANKAKMKGFEATISAL